MHASSKKAKVKEFCDNGKSLWLFAVPLVVVVVIFALWALPYAVTETYGLREKSLISIVTSVVLAVFAVDMLIFWIIQYRQTSHDIETLRKDIEWTKPTLEKPGTRHNREINQKEFGKKKWI